MALDVLRDATLWGPAFPEPFVRFDLEHELVRLRLLPKLTGDEGAALRAGWELYRRKLRDLQGRAGAIRVRNQVFEPLVERLGYANLHDGGDVETREGRESGGWLLHSRDELGSRLRVWSTEFEEDLDAPARRGSAFRFSHQRIAQRVLLTTGERLGLLTNGVELRILISDPARPESWIAISLDGWRRSRGEVPDSYRLLLALARPDGLRALADLVDKARLQQTRVTRELRNQARQAIERFVQELLDHPANEALLVPAAADREQLARQLWHEGLVVVYRLLFTLKLEATDDPARSFSFASTSLWRNTFSPSVALAAYARDVFDRNADTGRLLEDGVRLIFKILSEGLQATELNVRPLGGALFGPSTTPLVDRLNWGERAVAHLLDRLLWTPAKRGAEARQRVHYGSLDVEDLGRVYETLLELEPGIAGEPMCRLRRQKLEVVVPEAQGERYRPAAPATEAAEEDAPDDSPGDLTEDETTENEGPTHAKTRVEWIERIPPGRFYLRVGLGRKATGSYYTPHSFVRFLVQETLGPQVVERSPKDDPRPVEILKLKVLDPAMGSGHFLVEACRFLGAALYEAVRACDERALNAERRSDQAKSLHDRDAALEEARRWRQRIVDLPDPDDEIVKYLPSRAPEGEESGLSQRKAEALCRRLVAVHCLYGVDKNPLAVELAKLSLWIESHAEGLPLTFLDHRLIVGDSISGPFFEHLLKFPGSQQPLEDLFCMGLRQRLTAALQSALVHVKDLEASIGTSVAELDAKRAAKEHLDLALAPFRLVAAAWAGGVMLGDKECDDGAYLRLVQTVVSAGALSETIQAHPRLPAMVARGLGVDVPPSDQNAGSTTGGDWAERQSTPLIPALPYDLAFADVFYPGGVPARHGFDVVLSNPPWDTVTSKEKEWFASVDLDVLDAPHKHVREELQQRLLVDPILLEQFQRYLESFDQQKRAFDSLYRFQKVTINGDLAGRFLDLFRVFAERNVQLLKRGGYTGVVLPGAFHANEGASGVRRLYLEHLWLHECFSFENRKLLFEIHRSFKVVLVVASQVTSDQPFECAFYQTDDNWLFAEKGPELLRYTKEFVRQTGGEYLSFLEIRDQDELGICRTAYMSGVPTADVLRRQQIVLRVELNTTKDARRFERSPIGVDVRQPAEHTALVDAGKLILVEGKTFWHYEDRWGEPPRYTVPLARLSDRPEFVSAARFYRFGFRDVSSATNERTVVFCLLPPGVVFADTAKAPERRPQDRPNSAALAIVAIANSFVFDYLARLRASSHVSLFMLEGTPMTTANSSFLAHGALRLSCNHSGYERLWTEQLGGAWREQSSPFSWPVLATEHARWQLRCAIDALVAYDYRLDRQQYRRVLSSFSHASYPGAVARCIAIFDELHAIGPESFTREHDPYWDIPLNENLPQPVIDLPIPAGDDQEGDLLAPTSPEGGTYPEVQPSALRAADSRADYVVNDPSQKRDRGGPRRRSQT